LKNLQEAVLLFSKIDKEAYMEIVTIDKEIKIRSVKNLWEKIDETTKPMELDFKNFEKFDCAGFQFFLYLLKLTKEKPENYKISGLSDELQQTMTSYGYVLEKGVEKK